MHIAKLFTNGRSQAVRLPKAFRFEGNEVYIKKTAQGVLLLPKDESVWNVWEKSLEPYGEPLMEDRNQPEQHQQRDGVDEIFT